jgi:excisionase family DNA binding protein
MWSQPAWERTRRIQAGRYRPAHSIVSRRPVRTVKARWAHVPPSATPTLTVLACVFRRNLLGDVHADVHAAVRSLLSWDFCRCRARWRRGGGVLISSPWTLAWTFLWTSPMHHAAMDTTESPNPRSIPNQLADDRLVLSVAEAGALLGLSRAFAYELVARGELPVVRFGRRIVVPKAALLELLSGAPSGI